MSSFKKRRVLRLLPGIFPGLSVAAGLAAAGASAGYAAPQQSATPQQSAPSRQSAAPGAPDERTAAAIAQAGLHGAGPPVTLVLANATVEDALRMLSRVSGIKVDLLSQTRSEDLPLLSVVAQREPFFMLLQQIAMAEGLAVVPAGGGFGLFPASPGYPPLSARGRSLGGSFGGSPGRSLGGSFGGSSGGAAAPVPGVPPIVTSPSAAQPRGRSHAVPSTVPDYVQESAGASAPIREDVVSPNESDSSPGSADSRTDELLQLVLKYARNPAAEQPDRASPDLRTPAGSLKYVGIITEALTHLQAPPASARSWKSLSPSGGRAAADPVSRLRVLLGRAEELHHRACLKEQLQMEVILLTQRLPQADASIQPLLRSVLDQRQRQLAALEAD